MHKAEKTTTGGRLNFYKVTNAPSQSILKVLQHNFSSFSFLQILTNAVFLNNPIINNVPDVSVEPNVVALEADNSDGFVTSVHDPDGDTYDSSNILERLIGDGYLDTKIGLSQRSAIIYHVFGPFCW